jgi:hypothetical protein
VGETKTAGRTERMFADMPADVREHLEKMIATGELQPAIDQLVRKQQARRLASLVLGEMFLDMLMPTARQVAAVSRDAERMNGV